MAFSPFSLTITLNEHRKLLGDPHLGGAALSAHALCHSVAACAASAAEGPGRLPQAEGTHGCDQMPP